jgi:hypothetical protein
LQIGEDLWSTTRPMRFWGIETGTRMTVVRLRDGGLFVHSPVALDSATRAAVDALGPVRRIAAPSKFHHVFVPAWSAAYPEALLCCCPGLVEKRKDVRWQHVLGDQPDEGWRSDLEQVHFGARTLEDEVVFFHPRSRTLVCSDMVFNLRRHPSRLTRAAARLLGNREPGATYLEHAMIRNRPAARAQIDRMLAWDFDSIVLAHGEPVLEGGREVLRRAYAWL